jgi:hypothetical protein
MVKVVLPPARMDGVAKLLEMVGTDKLTGSTSEEEQTPLIHEVAVFVLLTEAGGLRTAVFVIPVWA